MSVSILASRASAIFVAPALLYTDKSLAIRSYEMWTLPSRSSIRTVTGAYAAASGTYLDQVRGLAPSTVAAHCSTAAALLTDIDYESSSERLHALSGLDLEAFISGAGARLKRASLQGMVAHVRSFLRFLASSGETAIGLDRQIDTPRVYREEQLPKALPWETVQAFLQASPAWSFAHACVLLQPSSTPRWCYLLRMRNW
jgi:hypothetical protein